MNARRNWIFSFFLLLAALLAGCGGGGNSATAPSISAQPASVSAVSGTSAVFSVEATGTHLSYQWQQSADSGATWKDIVDAIEAVYTLAHVSPSLNGYQFRMVITGSAGTVTSSAVTLTVKASVVVPSINVQPAPQKATEGGTASFSVTAAGTSLSYKWQRSEVGAWSTVSGAKAATLTLSEVSLSDDGASFRVIVSNSAGSVTSSAAKLSVSAAPNAPAITSQPANRSVIAGQTATFSVVAVGTPKPAYQWQKSSDGTTFANIASATGASYTTPATTSADNGKRFRVRVTNSAGSVTSVAARLTVSAGTAPAITGQPSARTVFLPATATFTAAASGTPTPALQWQLSTDGGHSFTNINGATSANYTTPATTAADNAKRFRVVATNVVGTMASQAAALTVINGGTGGTNPGIAVDSAGSIYVTVGPEVGIVTGQPTYYGVRKIAPSGTVVDLAGSVNRGYVDAQGAAARFEQPTGIAVNSARQVLVADTVNNVIRKVSTTGVVSTFAGNGQSGFTDGLGALASFGSPKGLAIDGSGNLYVADFSNHAIRKIAPSGAVTTLAGTGSCGNTNGPVASATLCAPLAVAVDGATVYFIQNMSFLLRKISAGTVSTVATLPSPGGASGLPSGLAVDSSGNIIVAAGFGVLKVTPAGSISTMPVGSSFVVAPPSIAIDAADTLYIPDQAQSQLAPHQIRKVTATGSVSLVP